MSLLFQTQSIDVQRPQFHVGFSIRQFMTHQEPSKEMKDKREAKRKREQDKERKEAGDGAGKGSIGAKESHGSRSVSLNQS